MAYFCIRHKKKGKTFCKKKQPKMTAGGGVVLGGAGTTAGVYPNPDHEVESRERLIQVDAHTAEIQRAERLARSKLLANLRPSKAPQSPPLNHSERYSSAAQP